MGSPERSTMHAVHLIGHGGPEKLVYRDDVPIPRPARGEVLLEVAACGMNNTDLWVRQGAYGTDQDPSAVASWRRGGEDTLRFPRIQGADIVGRIVECGEGVPRSRRDERVMVDFSIYNGDGEDLSNIDYIGHGRDGGYAEYVCVPAEQAYRCDSAIGDAELATYCCAYLTGEHMLDRAGLAAGQTVLISGASGGVGAGLIQLARARGALPYAICARDKMAAVEAVGAEAVIAREEQDLAAAIHDVTGHDAFDVVADLVGGELFPVLLNQVRVQGAYTTAGAIAGPLVTLDMRTLYLKHLTLHGSSQGSRSAFRRLHALIERGALRPLLWATFPLSRIHQAQAVFESKRYVGKMVIQPDSKWRAVEPWFAGAPNANS